MKKLFSLVAVLAVTVLFSSSAFAAVNLRRSAIANFSSAGEVSFSLDLKYIADDSDATVIDWDVANIPLNVDATEWTTSTVYAVLSSTVTKAGSAVYMYQDNANSTDYKAVDGRTENGYKIYSGMVNQQTQGGEYRGYIPLVFCSTTTKFSTATTPNFGTNPENIGGTRYFVDKSNENWGLPAANTTNYVTIANTGGLVGGVDAGGACWNVGSNTGYMYFGGLFKNILGGDVYGTDQIKVVETVE